MWSSGTMHVALKVQCLSDNIKTDADSKLSGKLSLLNSYPQVGLLLPNTLPIHCPSRTNSSWLREFI